MVITKANQGGAQRYVRDLAIRLPRERYMVAVAHGGSGWLHTTLAESGIRTIPLAHMGRNISMLREYRAALELALTIWRERPDILHLNSSKVGAFGAVIGRALGVPRIVFTAHGWPHNEKRPRIKRALIHMSEWITILLCHRTIAVSEAMYREAPLKKNVVVIHHGIEPPRFLAREEARRALGLAPDAFIIGTVAELHANKGLDILIRAAAHLPHTIAIIGGGEEHERLREEARTLTILDRVIFLGERPGAAALMRAFDIFVLPSRTESFGYVLLEAAHANLPVVASAVGGIPEIIHHEKTGILVPPENPEALAAALKKLAENGEARARLGSALFNFATTRFSLGETVSATMRVYAQ